MDTAVRAVAEELRAVLFGAHLQSSGSEGSLQINKDQPTLLRDLLHIALMAPYTVQIGLLLVAQALACQRCGRNEDDLGDLTVLLAFGVDGIQSLIVMIDKGGIVGTTVVHTDLNGDDVRVILGDQLLNAQTGIALAAFLVVQEILDHRAAPGAVDHHIIATAGLIQILLKPLRVAVHACGELFIVGNGVTGHDPGQTFLGSEDLFHSHAVIVLESGAALACRGCDGCEYRQHHAQDQRKGHEGF